MFDYTWLVREIVASHKQPVFFNLPCGANYLRSNYESSAFLHGSLLIMYLRMVASLGLALSALTDQKLSFRTQQ